MLPNFIGIGAPKSGTTWIFKVLNQHPEIYIPSSKELHFFADYNLNSSKQYQYEDYFTDVNIDKHKAIGEISTDYLKSIYAPQRVKEMIPNVKLFVSLRNPIDQAYSMYWHMLRQNFHQWQEDKIPSSFEEAIEKYEEPLLHHALYFTNIQNWLTYFDKSQLKIIFFDDIILEPQKTSSELFQFLEVDSKFVPLLLQNNSSTREGVCPKNPSYHEIYKFVYGFANKNIYHHMKKIIGMKNANVLKESLNIRYFFETFFFKKGYPEMKQETREYLKDYYREEISNLEILCERRLKQWL